MRKSSSVTLTLLAAAAALVTSGCTKTELSNCVDENNHIVDDYHCQSHNGGNVAYYHWLYHGSSGGHLGDTVFGGAVTPTPGVEAVSGFSVSRGGFGSSSEAGS
jgi:uncharacterized protein YgiB involved in biofilm formation